MKRGATFFLKGVILLIGILALVLCIFLVPEIASRDANAHPETAYLQYPFLLSAYLLSIPFFIALYKGFKLLIYIDKNKTFSDFGEGWDYNGEPFHSEKRESKSDSFFNIRSDM
jgi:hypothetical protein